MSRILIPGSSALLLPATTVHDDAGHVTNGNTHDHVSGDGAQIDHGGLAGLTDDDHSLYLKDSDFETAAWASHTPVLTAATTNPTLGSGSVQQGRYLPVGKMVIYRFLIQFGSSGAAAGSGRYRVSLPVNAAAVDPDDIYTTMGSGVLHDWSVGGHKELCTWQWGAATYLTGAVDNNSIFDNAPFVWTNDDRMSGTVTYQSV